MSEYPIPQGYVPCLGLYDTQKAIGMIKQAFEVKLCAALHLKRVTAPLFVDPALGLNDDLNGVERPASAPRWCTVWPSGSGWPCTSTVSAPATACSPT